MFRWFEVRIRRLPFGAQLAAWPFYYIYYGIWQALVWFFGEAFGQTKRKSKKVLAPIVWPIIAALAIIVIRALFGTDVSGTIVYLILVMVVLLIGLGVLARGFK
jgi:hypothetical protein